MLIGTALIFIVFGSAEIQKWNEIPDDVDKTETNTRNDNDLDIPAK